MSDRGTKRNKCKYTSKRTTPKTSSAKLSAKCVPSSKTNLPCGQIEDEEFPYGFTLQESVVSPAEEYFAKTKNLSLVAEFDELMRHVNNCLNQNAHITTEFLQYAKHQELCRLKWLKTVQECKRLQAELYKANHELGDFQIKLKNARRLLDQEKKIRKKVENERFNLEQQMMTARELLFNEQNWRIPDDTKEKLSFLNNNISSKSYSHLDKNIETARTRLNTISELNSAEINSTASLLSNFSYSRSDGEMDTSLIFKIKSEEWKRVNKENKSPQKPNTSSSTRKVVEINPTDKIIATTTLSMSKDGPITATSVIEAVPQSESDTSLTKTEEIRHKSPPKKANETIPIVSLIRCHTFASKTVLCLEPCAVCKVRIRFGKMVVKCKDCKAICHTECKNQLPVPCVPLLNIINRKPAIGRICDFTPTTPPMIPALLRYCITEIELRGLREIGLYRIPGVERDIKSLKERILRAKLPPNLTTFDVHVLCGVVKDFLRSLKEPLLTCSLRKDFIQAAEAKDELDVITCFYQAISQLPQPNRDTLAYVMLHLNRVAATRECKMPSSNLARIFGPTIVGYSSDNVYGSKLLAETKQQHLVMEYLMKIPIDFWSSFVDLNSEKTPRTRNIISTPSTDSLKATRRKFFTPEGSSSSSSDRKRKKYFTTPASYKK